MTNLNDFLSQAKLLQQLIVEAMENSTDKIINFFGVNRTTDELQMVDELLVKVISIAQKDIDEALYFYKP
jgi:hypothetical protein